MLIASRWRNHLCILPGQLSCFILLAKSTYHWFQCEFLLNPRNQGLAMLVSCRDDGARQPAISQRPELVLAGEHGRRGSCSEFKLKRRGMAALQFDTWHTVIASRYKGFWVEMRCEREGIVWSKGRRSLPPMLAESTWIVGYRQQRHIYVQMNLPHLFQKNENKNMTKSK